RSEAGRARSRDEAPRASGTHGNAETQLSEPGRDCRFQSQVAASLGLCFQSPPIQLFYRRKSPGSSPRVTSVAPALPLRSRLIERRTSVTDPEYQGLFAINPRGARRLGQAVLSAAIELREEHFPAALPKAAA